MQKSSEDYLEPISSKNLKPQLPEIENSEIIAQYNEAKDAYDYIFNAMTAPVKEWLKILTSLEEARGVEITGFEIGEDPLYRQKDKSVVILYKDQKGVDKTISYSSLVIPVFNKILDNKVIKEKLEICIKYKKMLESIKNQPKQEASSFVNFENQKNEKSVSNPHYQLT